MECNLKNRNEIITNYLMGELSEDEAKVFEEHYFQCEACFEELKAAEQAVNLIKQEGHLILNKKSSANKKFFLPVLSSPLRWGIAFAASVAALIFLIIFINRNDQEIFDDKITSGDKKSLEEKDSLNESGKYPTKDEGFIAELTGPAFESNVYLEEWITENVRSGNDILDTVFSPLIGKKFYDEEIAFKWNMTLNKEVSLKILTNQEKEIFNATPKQTQYLLSTIEVNPGVIKQPGLYYWRIEDENEVLYVGKFYFLKQ